MGKIPTPGYTCPYCGYSKPYGTHAGCGGMWMIDTDTGEFVCSKCGARTTSLRTTCAQCGKMFE